MTIHTIAINSVQSYSILNSSNFKPRILNAPPKPIVFDSGEIDLIKSDKDQFKLKSM